MPSPKRNPDVCTELFNRIYDETFDEMRKFVAQKCADTEDIPDILQETYLEYYRLILRKGSDYAQSNRALIYKIARRKLYRYYSLKDKMRVLIPFHGPDCDEDGQPWEDYADIETCVEDDAISKAESERIWKLISAYPVDVRKIFYLFFYENMSHTEIAKAMNCGVSNVKNKLYRTMREIEAKGE